MRTTTNHSYENHLEGEKLFLAPRFVVHFRFKRAEMPGLSLGLNLKLNLTLFNELVEENYFDNDFLKQLDDTYG